MPATTTDKNKTQSASAEKNGRAEAVDKTGDDLQRVRAILFGQKEGEIEARLNALERSISVSVEELRQHLADEFSRLGALIEQTSKELNRRAEAEETNRVEADSLLNEALVAHVAEASEQLKESGSALETALESVRKRLEESASETRDDLLARIDGLNARHEESADRLSGTKADKSELANMFDSLARNLRGE